MWGRAISPPDRLLHPEQEAHRVEEGRRETADGQDGTMMTMTTTAMTDKVFFGERNVEVLLQHKTPTCHRQHRQRIKRKQHRKGLDQSKLSHQWHHEICFWIGGADYPLKKRQCNRRPLKKRQRNRHRYTI